MSVVSIVMVVVVVVELLVGTDACHGIFLLNLDLRNYHNSYSWSLFMSYPLLEVLCAGKRRRGEGVTKQVVLILV